MKKSDARSADIPYLFAVYDYSIGLHNAFTYVNGLSNLPSLSLLPEVQ